MIGKFLGIHLDGFVEGGRTFQKCITDKLIQLYDGAEAHCKWCKAMGDPRAVQLAGDIEFTLGPQLLATSSGGPRFRYLFDVEAGGGNAGATHSVDLCYLLPTPLTPQRQVMCGKGHMRDRVRLGALMRHYFATFASKGVPAAADGSIWMQTDPGRSSPMIRFQLAPHVEGKMYHMQSYSNTSATLLGDIACGRVRAEQTSGAGGICTIAKADDRRLVFV